MVSVSIVISVGDHVPRHLLFTVIHLQRTRTVPSVQLSQHNLVNQFVRLSLRTSLIVVRRSKCNRYAGGIHLIVELKPVGAGCSF